MGLDSILDLSSVLSLLGVWLVETKWSPRLTPPNVKGFIRNACIRQGKESEQEALRIKACWTEPLVRRAKLASSMGIVKGNAAATKVAQVDHASRLPMSAGSVLSVGEFRA